MMKGMTAASVAMIGFLTGCATGGPDLGECVQPDRRVVLEVNGTRTIPAKPDPKADPKAPPPKPTVQTLELSSMAQGNTAFDPNSAVLKEGGKQDIDAFWKEEVIGKIPAQ